MKQYILDITPDAAQGLATLRLTDAHEVQVGFNQVRFADHPASRWEGLFDTGGYVKRYAGNLTPAGRAAPYTEPELLAELGVFLARALLDFLDVDPWTPPEWRNYTATGARRTEPAGIEPATLEYLRTEIAPANAALDELLGEDVGY